MPESLSDFRGMPNAAVLLPVLDDWKSLEQILSHLWDSLSPNYGVTFWVVDDGSSSSPPVETIFRSNWSWHLIRLGCNLGHQRAICVGLSAIISGSAQDVVIVMDSDGEDDPGNAVVLADALRSGPSDIVVAQRASRSEGTRFKVFYSTYKLAFRILVGERLDFGNFSALSPSAAKRLLYMSETWNHYPGAIMRSRLLVSKVPTARGTRIAGTSQMNMPALVTHGLAGLSVFLDKVMSRLLLAFSLLLGILAAVIALGIFVRLAGQVPIPGWLALVTTAAFIGVVQISATLLILAFVALSARARPSTPPFEFSQDFILRTASSRGLGDEDSGESD